MTKGKTTMKCSKAEDHKKIINNNLSEKGDEVMANSKQMLTVGMLDHIDENPRLPEDPGLPEVRIASCFGMAVVSPDKHEHTGYVPLLGQWIKPEILLVLHKNLYEEFRAMLEHEGLDMNKFFSDRAWNAVLEFMGIPQNKKAA